MQMAHRVKARQILFNYTNYHLPQKKKFFDTNVFSTSEQILSYGRIVHI